MPPDERTERHGVRPVRSHALLRCRMELTGTGLAARRGLRTIFTDVSFALRAGELMTVTGPNGSGKSTLMRIVAGLMRPLAGTVRLDPARENGVGGAMHYLGHLDGLKPGLSVRQNLDFWRRYHRGDAPTAAMDRMGVTRLADLPVSVLSAGQKRRTAFARLLASKRPVWLLDEPLTALDAAGEAILAEVLREHLAGGGIAIAATHRALPVQAATTLAIRRPGATA